MIDSITIDDILEIYDNTFKDARYTLFWVGNIEESEAKRYSLNIQKNYLPLSNHLVD